MTTKAHQGKQTLTGKESQDCCVPISTAQSCHISIQTPVVFEVKQSGVGILSNKILYISWTVFRQKPWDAGMSVKTFVSLPFGVSLLFITVEVQWEKVEDG